MHARRLTAGFSLVEILIVITVLGILGALVIPRSDTSVNGQLRAAARLLASDLEYARSLAVTNSSRYRISFDASTNCYVLEHSGSNSALDELPDSPLASPGDPPDKRTVRLDDLPAVARSSVRLHALRLVGSSLQKSGQVEFDSLGQTSASEATEVWLAAGSGSEARFVPLRIDPVTGTVWAGPLETSGPSGTTDSTTL